MEKMVSLADAADVVGVHPVTLRRLIHKGEIPATRIGRQWRVRLSDLEATYHGEPTTPSAPRSAGTFRGLADELAGTGARTPSA